MAHSRITVPLACKLRLTPTDSEIRLWSRLRQLGGFRFRRRHPLGPYVVDFFCAEARLIVEVDGGQHADDGEARTRWLDARGYRVVRLWNNDVLANTDGVLRMMLDALRAAPLPNLPLKGGGGLRNP
jgi:very-short-patch-repair endonuclease